MIDHTLLKADATSAEIERLCAEASRFGFASVCVQPYRVREAARFLTGRAPKVCTVLGFPLGATRVKAQEAAWAVSDGATELDMVLNIGAVKDGNWPEVEGDIRAVVQAAGGNLVKVILETSLLTDQEIVRACQCSVLAGAQFVKTSTGFSAAGATTHHVALMRATVGPGIGVKASGGLRDFAKVSEMILAGANRIGTSSGVALVEGLPAAEGSY